MPASISLRKRAGSAGLKIEIAERSFSMKRSNGSRLFCLALAAVMASAVLSGCGTNRVNQSSSSGTSSVSSSDSDKAVTLQAIMWGEQARWDAQRKVNDAFTAKYPNLTVKLITIANQDDYWTKVQTMIAGGTPPDLAFEQEMLTPTHVAKGFMEDLTPYMQKDSSFHKDWLAPASYGPFTVNNQIYAIPEMTYVDVLFYNRTMFDKAKLSYPNSTWDWNKLREVAKKLTLDTNNDGKIDQYGYSFIAYPNFLYTYMWANGGDLVLADRKTAVVNSKQNVEAFQFLHDLIYKDKVTPSPQINKDNAFSFETGKVAMLTIGSWDTATCDLNKLNYGIALPPKAPTGKRVCNEYPNGWFMVKTSKHKDDVWKYLSFCASPDGQKITAEGKVGMPTNTEIANSDAYLKSSTTPGVDLSVTLEGQKIARPAYPSSNWTEVQTNVWPIFDELWTNSNASAQTVLDKVQTKLQAMLDAAK